MAEVIQLSTSYDKNEEKFVLTGIKNVLLVEKMFGDFITKTKLSKIVDNAKKDIKDIRVSSAIDDLFDQYFKDIPKNVETKGDVLPIEKLQSDVEQKMEYLDTGGQKGVSLVKRDSHFNSSNDTAKPAA